MRFWSNLTPRDRLALIVGGIAVIITAIVFGGILPYQASLDRLDSRITARQRQLVEVQGLRQEYMMLQRQVTEAENRLAQNRNFSLFSFIEATTAQVATRENLIYMRPQPTTTQDGLREESVEIRLERLRLDQLVRFLYSVETADAYLQVKNLRVRTRFDDRTQLDAVMNVSTYGRS